jgi:hypothetical protein
MNGLSRLSGVAMVETSDQQEFNNLSHLWPVRTKILASPIRNTTPSDRSHPADLLSE